MKCSVFYIILFWLSFSMFSWLFACPCLHILWAAAGWYSFGLTVVVRNCKTSIICSFYSGKIASRITECRELAPKAARLSFLQYVFLTLLYVIIEWKYFSYNIITLKGDNWDARNILRFPFYVDLCFTMFLK